MDGGLDDFMIQNETHTEPQKTEGFGGLDFGEGGDMNHAASQDPFAQENGFMMSNQSDGFASQGFAA